MDWKVPNRVKVVAVFTLLLGVAMLVYWGMYLFQGMPLAGIPILSELVNAGLALVSGIGMLSLKRWSIPTSLFTAGMWAYGLIGGINLVLEHGLDFGSPFGAFTDALLFPLVLIFAVVLAIVVWRNREMFHK